MYFRKTRKHWDVNLVAYPDCASRDTGYGNRSYNNNKNTGK